ncbi:MAG: DUF1566 domain-containing protein [bacterium]
MFRTHLLPIWVGILLLSGMFLMGQETWPPQGPTSPVPDTGITECSDNTQGISCPSPGEPFFGQDAQYGPNVMSFTDNGNGTITDNVTGLMWQREDDATTRTWSDAISYCDSLVLGSYTDWRLPNVYEIESIVDYSSYNPAIDLFYFPGTNSSGFVYYWSSSSDALHPERAWFLYFLDGDIGSIEKSHNYYARCVRRGSTTKSFIENANGTVTDTSTGLMWQKEDDDVLTRDWEGALEYCESLSLANHTDWRLPNIKELSSIVDNTRYNPAIDLFYFPGTNSCGYLSSSTHALYPTHLWFLDFFGGEVRSQSKIGTIPVRCVR